MTVTVSCPSESILGCDHEWRWVVRLTGTYESQHCHRCGSDRIRRGPPARWVLLFTPKPLRTGSSRPTHWEPKFLTPCGGCGGKCGRGSWSFPDGLFCATCGPRRWHAIPTEAVESAPEGVSPGRPSLRPPETGGRYKAPLRAVFKEVLS